MKLFSFFGLSEHVERQKERKRLDAEREQILSDAASMGVKKRMAERVDEKTGEVEPRFVPLREQTDFDFAVKCIRCGELMPVEHSGSFMGKCAKCAAEKFDNEEQEFRHNSLKYALVAMIVGVLAMIVCSMLLKGGFAPYFLHDAFVACSNPLSVPFVVLLVFDLCLLCDFARRKTSAENAKRLTKEIYVLGVLAFVFFGFIGVVGKIIVVLFAATAFSVRFFERKKQKEFLNKFRFDTVAFKAKLLKESEKTSFSSADRDSISDGEQ